jgi:deoxyadenosine/deoxycytidine kinase
MTLYINGMSKGEGNFKTQLNIIINQAKEMEIKQSEKDYMKGYEEGYNDYAEELDS